MGVYDNMNYSYSAGIKPTLVETYLQRKAMKNVTPNLRYLDDADMIDQPLNNGKSVTMWRYTELPAITKPLYEGVTPDGQQLTETAFSVMTKPYGGYMPYTDEIDLFHVDKKTDAIAERLNRQAALSVDTVGRDQICAGLNVMYPGAVTSRAALTKGNILTYAIIKKVVRNLKRKGAQPFADGYFHGKIDQDTYYDLTNDDNWKDANKYQDKTRERSYELGEIYKVKFFEVDNGKVFANETYLYGEKAYLTASANFDATNRIMTVSDSISVDEARELTGKMVYVQYTKDATAYVTPMCIEKVTGNQILFRWVPGTSVTDEWVTTQALKVVPSGGASNGDEVHATIIYGQHAFGMVKLGGTKVPGTKKVRPNIRIIVKPLGSSGSDDPLDQRGTIGWKVRHFACAVIQDDFICRIEHGVSD